MRIAVYKFGRENNGGHTTVCVDLKKFCDLNGIDTHFYSYSPGKKKRKMYLNPDANFEFDEFCEYDSIAVLNELNTYDLIILLEPPNKSGTKHDCKVFMDIYKKATPKKWYQYHDAQLRQTSRNRALLEAIAYSDIVSVHHLDSLVANIARKSGKRVEKIKLFRKFDDMQEAFDNENRRREVMYIGRFEAWKGPTLMLKIGKQLREESILPTMIGIDRSMASYHCLLSNELVENGTIQVEGRYNFDYGFARLKNAMFSFTPTNLANHDYGNRMEYCQLEAISSGCIPILHKDQGENCTLEAGTKWIDIPFFAVWFDEENPENTIRAITDIANDEHLQKKFKGTALKYMKRELDYSNFMPHITNIIDSKVSRCELDDILRRYGWVDEEINKYKLANENYFIKHDLDLLENKKIKIITGKRGGTTPYEKILEGGN